MSNKKVKTRNMHQLIIIFLIFLFMNLITPSQSQEVNLIIAVDTSGSTGYNRDYLREVSDGIKIFLNSSSLWNNRVNVGLVSWDDDIDFIITPNKNYYRSSDLLDKLSASEYEGTDFRQMMKGVNLASDDLGNSYYKNAIIVITSESEWSGSDYILDKNKYIINFVCIGFPGDNKEKRSFWYYLKNLTKEYGGTIYSTPLNSQFISQALSDLMREFENNIIQQETRSAKRDKINNSIIKKMIRDSGADKELIFSNLVIDDDLILKQSSFNQNLVFYNCIFKGPVDISNAYFRNSLKFIKCYFEGGAFFNISNTQFNSLVEFSDSEFESPANFTNSVFNGRSIFQDTKFDASVKFERSNFEKDVTFRSANFIDDAAFESSIFKGPTNFVGSFFNQDATFKSVKFNGPVDFKRSGFNKNAIFIFSQFNGSADFNSTKFNEIVNFESDMFSGSANFWKSNFSGDADFKSSIFDGPVSFIASNFNKTLCFESVNFNDTADFRYSKFIGNSIFNSSEFDEAANFKSINFNDVCFGSVIFKGPTMFSDSNFRKNTSFEFSKFEGISEFVRSNYSQNAAFMNCVFNESADFSEANFKEVANFGSISFNGPANFKYSIFRGTLNLTKAKINHIESFNWPYFINKINCEDRITFIELIKNFRDMRRYEAADEIYYQYRDWDKNQLNWTDSSKWIAIASLYTCGYGVKPFYTINFAIYSLIFFGLIYFLLMWNRREDNEFSSSELVEALSFSAILLLSAPKDLYPQGDQTYDSLIKLIKARRFIKYIPIVERLIGWGILILLINTFSRIMIPY